jgi:hypothetical protein
MGRCWSEGTKLQLWQMRIQRKKRGEAEFKKGSLSLTRIRYRKQIRLANKNERTG